MIQISIFIVLAAVVAGFLARSLTRLRIARLLVTNRRGRQVPAVLGVALAGGSGGVLLGALATAAAGGRWTDGASATALVSAGALVVVIAGFVDDVTSGTDRGWRGHLGAAGRGRATSGLLKLVLISSAAGIVAWGTLEPSDAAGWGATVAATVVIAGCSNVWNGLDVAPGRAGKWFLLVGIVLAVVAAGSPGWAVLVVVLGGELGVIGFDLRERGMLGDTGSNLLGFVLGCALVPALPLVGLIVAAVVVVGLNVLAETVTFSAMIEGVPPLRWFDRLGRMPPGPTFSSN